MDDMKLKELIKIYESMESSPKETSKLVDIPYVEVIPRMEKDYACPYCHELWREKDFSFDYQPELNGYTHSCCNKPFRMLPSGNSLFNESYGIESHESGFKEVGEASNEDIKKIDAIVNDSSLPEEAEEGKAYIVHWADGRGRFACKYKSYLSKWLKETGSWAEIVCIKYGDKDKLKVINEK